MKKIFDIKVAALSAIICPLGVFLHELIHMLFMHIGGIDSELISLSMAAPVNFAYDISGLLKAADYYGSENFSVFLAAISAPFFTLLTSFLGLFLFIKYRKRIFFVVSISPLFMRILAISLKLPSYINKSITGSDEAIAAYFMGYPNMTFYIPSLIFGYACLFLAVAVLKRSIRLKYLLSTVMGSLAGFIIFEFAGRLAY